MVNQVHQHTTHQPLLDVEWLEMVVSITAQEDLQDLLEH
jgi:hypothetical protein